MKRTWENQFTISVERPLYMPTWLIEELIWEDVSLGNEACPRFESPILGLSIWVDFDEPTDREFEDWKKFTVVELHIADGDERILGETNLFETDSEEELIVWLQEYPVRQAMGKVRYALAVVLEGLQTLPENPLNLYRISMIEATIDDFNSACEAK